ncbi:DegQ family serine endoprotease [Tianweitania sp. BSSL-BM11]|uniref:DegQ family serine endoprotease n=1 Tax=Tianweitania aestuarii TaxID=2814886 RepID=A0ABS5RTK3_9HYPH|nr:DegQ family serine endoprotease [Tianweitania aestuarii]MBS9720373.1 DegQ family serine endoprotease [Tianweitania aestuarii]
MALRSRSALVASVLVAALGLGSVAMAQEEQGGLRSLLGDLMGSKEPEAQASQQPEPNEPAPAHAAPDPQRRVPFGQAELQLSYAPLVKTTAPAVVNVYASRKPRGVPSPFAGDPFFEQFFGRQLPPRAQSALGSGVIVDGSGLIVTNNHVIKDADEVKVALADGREFESKILLKDESLDLAVLKIDGTESFPVIKVGDSEALEVGDLVLAIGNPFGVGQTTTSGIVSALARTHIGVSDFGFFIQTDAAINPGNSGGALIDMRGNLIGINTAIYSRSGGSIGIGFAIPSNIVKAVVASAKAGNDYFERPFIGATFDPVTAPVAEALGMPRPSGALVSNVYAEGPAEKAGLRPGDVVVAMDGSPVESPDGMGYRLATLEIGATVTVNVLRSGKEVTLPVELVRAPESETGEVDIDGDSPLSGAKIAELSPGLAQRLNLPITSTGVIILDVASRSPAAQVGFRRNDIVRELNQQPIKTASDLIALTKGGSRYWRIAIERDGRIIQQTLRY